MTAPGILRDPVPPDAPGAREIGFAVPERYNASAILFDNLAAGRSDKPAILCRGEATSYGALCADAAAVGRGLAALGLARGDRVVMLLHDSPAYAAAVFGAIRAGFVPVLVNTLSPPDLVAYVLEDSGAPAAIVESELMGCLGIGRGALRDVVVHGDAARADAPDGIATHPWPAWLATHLGPLAAADTHRDEMVLWMYSSGSTGRPKGVVHLQHDLPYTQASYGRHLLQLSADDVVFSVPKIFFAYGFGNSLTFPFSVGAAAVLHPGRPEPAAVFEHLERDRPTVLFGLPTLYTALVAQPGAADRDLSSLRLCISAAEALPAELFHEWRRRYGLEIVEGLGSTELLHIYVSNRPGAVRLGATGQRVPGYEIKLCDPDGAEVATGEAGAMWVRGGSSAPCYWNRPDKTAETMRGEWIYTGDRFRRDEDGYFRFEGRADELLKVSGQWVHPLEIERCLNEHPEVLECAVLGVTDARGLTVTKAFVALRAGSRPDEATARRLQDYVKQALLPYKYPRLVEFLEALPKTGTDKIDRQALRAPRRDP